MSDDIDENPWRNKAYRADYNHRPFYFWDKRIADCPRLVAWSPDCRHVREAVLTLLSTFPETVDVLLKNGVPPVEERDYERWHGAPTRKAVEQVLEEFAWYVFKCGYEVLCLLNTETDEYIALDEFGLIWFYTGNTERANLLEQCDFVQSELPLIDEGGCYVSRHEACSHGRQMVIDSLGLERIPNSKAPQF